MTGDTRHGPSRLPAVRASARPDIVTRPLGVPAQAEHAAADPELVRVVRPGHPLHGLDLPVWRRLRLRGVAMLELVLPDGSKKRIPASWTGDGTSPQPPAGGVAAAAGDLLRVLQLMSGIPPTSAVLAEQAARQPPAEEDNRAACTAESAAGPGSGATIRAGQPATPAHHASGGRDPDAPDHPGCATRTAAEVSGGE